MHTFQPYPIDMLDINPFTKLSKEWALVTAGDKEKSNTMTVFSGAKMSYLFLSGNQDILRIS